MKTASRAIKAKKPVDDFWCECKEPGEAIYHPDNPLSKVCQKHYWACSKCKKVIQVG